MNKTILLFCILELKEVFTIISLQKIGGQYNEKFVEINGLSTDEKPLENIGNILIKNGSTFLEIDTGKKYKFDAENKKWYKYNTDTFSGGGVGISVNPDYDQCDETQPDYIKNRTHYKEIIHQEKVDLLPATEIDFSSLGGVYSQSEPLNIQVGDTVKVLWDNQEYECVAQSVATLDPEGRSGIPSDGVAFGNLYYVFEVDRDSRDIPFFILANYTINQQQGGIISGCAIQPISELTSPITVNIFTSGDKTVYHKLDVNYLPISNSNISTDENNIVTSKPLLNYLRANRSDWGINDSDDPRYIENRPFYRDLWGTSTSSLISRTITFDENGIYASQEQLYNFNDIWNNSEGDISLTVHWHDGTYNCILRELYTEWTDEEGLFQNCNYFVFGNVSDIDYDYSSDSSPFLIYTDFNPETNKTGETYIKAYDGFTGELTLQVDAEYRYWGYITLDNKYLNLSTNVFQGDNHPVTGDAVYNKIQSAIDNEIQSAIDNKIQSAIDNEIQPAIDNKIQSAIGNEIQPAIDNKIQSAIGNALGGSY